MEQKEDARYVIGVEGRECVCQDYLSLNMNIFIA